MADRRLDEVSAATDFSYAYTEDSSNNQVKISKADMASVLAEANGIMYKQVALNPDETVEISKGYGMMLIISTSSGSSHIFKLHNGYSELIAGSSGIYNIERIGEYKISISHNFSSQSKLTIIFFGV